MNIGQLSPMEIELILPIYNKNIIFFAGIRSETIQKSENMTQDELLDAIANINNDDSIDGLLVQLPLPDHMGINIQIFTHNVVILIYIMSKFHTSHVLLYIYSKCILRPAYIYICASDH